MGQLVHRVLERAVKGKRGQCGCQRKEYDFTQLKKAEPKYLRRMKAAVTMRLDTNVIAYFRSLANGIGMPYQSLINYVLSEYAQRKLQPSANWGAALRKTTRAAAG